MELIDILEKQCCRIDLKSRTKDDVLGELATLACRSSALREDRIDEVRSALQDREAQGSTGFGNGIAIPHARMPDLDRFVLTIGVHPGGVDFNALDRKKVRLFIVILGPQEEVNDHLKLLASVSRTLTRTNAEKELLAAGSDEALREAFLRNAEGLGKKNGGRPKLKLMVLILFLEEYVYEILELYLQLGIEGATVLDSVGMGQYISNVPIFATFIGFMQESKNSSKTILAMIPEEREQEVVEGLETILGDLDRKQGAMIFSLDVGMYKGSMKML